MDTKKQVVILEKKTNQTNNQHLEHQNQSFSTEERDVPSFNKTTSSLAKDAWEAQAGKP